MCCWPGQCQWQPSCIWGSAASFCIFPSLAMLLWSCVHLIESGGWLSPILWGRVCQGPLRGRGPKGSLVRLMCRVTWFNFLWLYLWGWLKPLCFSSTVKLARHALEALTDKLVTETSRFTSYQLTGCLVYKQFLCINDILASYVAQTVYTSRKFYGTRLPRGLACGEPRELLKEAAGMPSAGVPGQEESCRGSSFFFFLRSLIT